MLVRSIQIRVVAHIRRSRGGVLRRWYEICRTRKVRRRLQETIGQHSRTGRLKLAIQRWQELYRWRVGKPRQLSIKHRAVIMWALGVWRELSSERRERTRKMRTAVMTFGPRRSLSRGESGVG